MAAYWRPSTDLHPVTRSTDAAEAARPTAFLWIGLLSTPLRDLPKCLAGDAGQMDDDAEAPKAETTGAGIRRLAPRHRYGRYGRGHGR